MSRVPSAPNIPPAPGTVSGQGEREPAVHPCWLAMIRFCKEMGYGEISCVKIHEGLPISAEVVIKKIRWC